MCGRCYIQVKNKQIQTINVMLSLFPPINQRITPPPPPHHDRPPSPSASSALEHGDGAHLACNEPHAVSGRASHNDVSIRRRREAATSLPAPPPPPARWGRISISSTIELPEPLLVSPKMVMAPRWEGGPPTTARDPMSVKGEKVKRVGENTW